MLPGPANKSVSSGIALQTAIEQGAFPASIYFRVFSTVCGISAKQFGCRGAPMKAPMLPALLPISFAQQGSDYAGW
jgi:hypothetical protein